MNHKGQIQPHWHASHTSVGHARQTLRNHCDGWWLRPLPNTWAHSHSACSSLSIIVGTSLSRTTTLTGLWKDESWGSGSEAKLDSALGQHLCYACGDPFMLTENKNERMNENKKGAGRSKPCRCPHKRLFPRNTAVFGQHLISCNVQDPHVPAEDPAHYDCYTNTICGT